MNMESHTTVSGTVRPDTDEQTMLSIIEEILTESKERHPDAGVERFRIDYDENGMYEYRIHLSHDNE